jgi:hypothetical protein
MTQLAPNPKPTAKARAPKPSKEEVRKMVVADQAAALKDAASSRAKPAKPDKAKAKTKPDKAADTRKITVLAKQNPHAAGSKRAGWFKQLKTGMTVEEAVDLGVRSIYLTRMAARGVVRLT